MASTVNKYKWMYWSLCVKRGKETEFKVVFLLFRLSCCVIPSSSPLGEKKTELFIKTDARARFENHNCHTSGHSPDIFFLIESRKHPSSLFLPSEPWSHRNGPRTVVPQRFPFGEISTQQRTKDEERRDNISVRGAARVFLWLWWWWRATEIRRQRGRRRRRQTRHLALIIYSQMIRFPHHVNSAAESSFYHVTQQRVQPNYRLQLFTPEFWIETSSCWEKRQFEIYSFVQSHSATRPNFSSMFTCSTSRCSFCFSCVLLAVAAILNRTDSKR